MKAKIHVTLEGGKAFESENIDLGDVLYLGTHTRITLEKIKEIIIKPISDEEEIDLANPKAKE